MEMCLNCEVFRSNIDLSSMADTCQTLDTQFSEFRDIVAKREEELTAFSLELAVSMSEVFVALKKISKGDPTVRIPEESSIELISKLKNLINLTAADMADFVHQAHEFAIGLAEHFDVLQRVTKDDLNARVRGTSQVELLEALKNVTNRMIENISMEITARKEREVEITQSRNAFFNMLKDIDLSYQDLKGLHEGLIHSFVNAIDTKSKWTKGHSERVTLFSVAIARYMKLNREEIEKLRIASLLHDIGKLGTYDVILDKPGRLNAEEYALIKKHPEKGAEILKPIKQLRNIISIVMHHHEQMDGSGYPGGLTGENIPLMARIVHVADSFDSMTADRPYRTAPGKEYAISELKKYSGSQFDPMVVEAFLKVLNTKI
jgi:putative nucleotidyltransferase with HDIG domain